MKKKSMFIFLLFLFLMMGRMDFALADSKYTWAFKSMIFWHLTDQDTVISNSNVCLDIVKTIEDKAKSGASTFEDRNNSIFITVQLDYLEKTMKEQLTYVPDGLIDVIAPGIHQAISLAKEAVVDSSHPNYARVNQIVSAASKRIIEVKTEVQQ